MIDTSGGDPDDRRILNVSAMAIRSLSPCGRGLSLSLGHKGFVPDVISNLYLVIPLALSFWLRNTPPSLGGHQHASSGNRGARRRVGRLCVELSGSFGELRFARHVSTIHVPTISIGSSSSNRSCGYCFGGSGSKTQQRRPSYCGGGGDLLASSVLCRRQWPNGSRISAAKRPNGRGRAGFDPKEMRDSVSGQAAGGVMLI